MTLDGIPKEMTAVQVTKFNQPYEIRKIPTPTVLGDYDMLLKTVVASLCHTDSMLVEAKFPSKLPIVASHEGTGIVKAVGSKVTNFKVGDRVMSGLPRNQCGQCSDCKGPNDWHQYCARSGGIIGLHLDGAFADYHVVDSRSSCHIPNNVSCINAAPLACAGITIYRAIIVSEVKEGGWLAIVGAGGGVGHLGIQFANAKGINVIAVDARDEGLEVCRKAGAKHVVDARKGREEVLKAVKDLTSGFGVEATINVSEHATAAPLSCAITRTHGTVIQVAQPDMVSVPFQELVFRDIRVKGTLTAGQEYSQQMLDDVSKNNIKVETNLFYGLEEVPKMVELAHSGKMKGKAICVVDAEELEKEKSIATVGAPKI